MARQVLTIANMPARGGLATAGQHGTIREDMFWQLENCSAGIDGVITKRPGIYQWGQVIKQPTGTENADGSTWSAYEPFVDDGNVVDNAGSEYISYTVADNELVININDTDSGSETEVIGFNAIPGQIDNDEADWSIRFVLRVTNMPTDGEIIVAAKSRSGDDPYAYKILPTKVQVYAAGPAWTDVGDVGISDKGIMTIELRSTGEVYVDETLVGTGTPIAYSALSVGSYLEFTFTATADNSPHSYFITDLMFDGAEVSSDDPFDAQRIGAGSDFKAIVAGNAVRRYLVCASTNYVYVDVGLRRYWRPLLDISGGNVTFSQFSDELLIFDADNAYSSVVYRWDGVNDPELLDDAPDVRFGTEHRSRLFAAGDKSYPLRLYFTAVDQPNVWFAPESDADGQESFDEVTQAGYILLPGKRGDEITAVYGEFYGDCIVCTNRGVWRIVGASPYSFQLLNITQDVGLGAQNALERLGNDLWGAGRQGILTLQTIQEFGDVKAAMPSGPIANLWDPGLANTGVAVDQDQLYKASMAWNPTLGVMLFAFAQRGSADVNLIYAYNTANQMWYGPWTGDTVFVTSVEVASPVQQTILHCTNTGKVGIADPNYKADFGVAYTATIESPYLSGRSVDSSLAGMQKTWKTLRLFFQPRGGWDIDITFQVDDETYDDITVSQNMYNLHELGRDWRLGVDPDGRIHTQYMIGVVEVPLDRTGRYFKFEISTADDYIGEDMLFQGYEVEFSVNGPDKEQE